MGNGCNGRKSNVVLVGVAGVGKTTIGKLASEKMGMPFIDVDMGFEEAEEFDIDTLLDKYGEREFDREMLDYFTDRIRERDRAIFASPGRLAWYGEFWRVVKSNGVSIHIRGKPMEVYMRQDVWTGDRNMTKEEKLDEYWKRDFYDYYNWRLRHCLKADYTVRIIGNKQTDAESLCKKIAEVLNKLDKNYNQCNENI